MMTRLCIVALWSLAPAAALAGTPVNGRVPEPETLALLGIGVVALVVAKWRARK